jgi:chromosome segregation ATPase
LLPSSEIPCQQHFLWQESVQVNSRISHWTQNLGELEARIAALETKVAQLEQATTRVDSMARCIINLTSQLADYERKLQQVQEAQEQQAARVLQVPQTH